jgi:hypothetical protein
MQLLCRGVAGQDYAKFGLCAVVDGKNLNIGCGEPRLKNTMVYGQGG